MTKSLSHDRLLQVLDYNRDTGIFKWKVATARKVRVGMVAGTSCHLGYVRISLDTGRYLAHRLAWFYCHKSWPDVHIDHIDNNPSNNALSNLRSATISQNMMNSSTPSTNTSGFKGVSFSKRQQAWHAYITAGGKRTHLGYHKSPELAYAAYCDAAQTMHGQYARLA